MERAFLFYSGMHRRLKARVFDSRGVLSLAVEARERVRLLQGALGKTVLGLDAGTKFVKFKLGVGVQVEASDYGEKQSLLCL